MLLNYFYNQRLQLLILFCFITNITLLAQNRTTLTGNISDKFGNLPGAEIEIEGSTISTISDINGNYTLNLEEGNYIVRASFVMYKQAEKTVNLKVGDSLKLDFKLEPGFSIDESVSLGSKSKPKSLLYNTVPVDIISSEELANSSQAELSQALHYLLPSFHSTHQTIADGTDHIDPATLRGLGPDQVLVLVNKKRKHASALLNVNGTVGRGSVGTDFNTIPLNAIERIEVLRDGATSQYGSDAIAGVINIVLKKQNNHINIDNRFLLNTEGDGFTKSISSNFGFHILKKGFINITGEFRERGPTNRAGNYTGAIYSNNSTKDATSIENNDFFNQNNYKNKRVMQIGSAETRNTSLVFNSEIPITTNTNFYFFGGRNYREGKSKGFYRFPKDEDRVVLELFPNGYSPELQTDIQDNSIGGGIKGIKNDWTIDFSHITGFNSIDFTVNNSLNASLGKTSPKTFKSGGYLYKLNTTNIDLSRDINFLQGANLALGAELRVENYEIIAGEEASYIDGKSTYIDENGELKPRLVGAQLFPGIQPVDELKRFRSNIAGYIDFETNATKNLLIKGAVRYESYNDFKNSIIGKLSSRYKFSKNLSLRTSYSTGFRAPSLHQIYFQKAGILYGNDGSIKQVGTFNHESTLVSDAFSIKHLTPELSSHFSLGISSKLNNTISIGLDYYRINIDNRIVLSNQFGEGFESILSPFNVNRAQFLANTISSKTQGIDASLQYKKHLTNGDFNAKLSTNFTATTTKFTASNYSKLASENNTILYNREEKARIENGQPNFKIISLLSYSFKNYKLQLNNSYFGSVKYIHINDDNPENWATNTYTGKRESRDQIFKPKLLTDISVSYRFKNWGLFTFGVNNLFNIYPDRHYHSANTDNGNFTYNRRVQQFGVNGANLFTRLNIKL